MNNTIIPQNHHNYEQNQYNPNTKTRDVALSILSAAIGGAK